MKTVMKLIAVIALSGGLISAAFAGGWSHGTYSPGSFGGSVYVPAPAHVQQILQAFNYNVYDWNGNYAYTVFGQVVNDGPLGSYNCTAGPQQYYSGDIGGGNPYVYQVVMGSGYSVTVITW